MRRRTALVAAAFLAQGDVGVWALGRKEGVRECLALIGSGGASIEGGGVEGEGLGQMAHVLSLLLTE